MNEKQNTKNQLGNRNSSANTISQDIFVKPIMSSETRGKNNMGIQMRRTTFTKDENNNCFFNCIKQSYDNFANIGTPKSHIINRFDTEGGKDMSNQN